MVAFTQRFDRNSVMILAQRSGLCTQRRLVPPKSAFDITQRGLIVEMSSDTEHTSGSTLVHSSLATIIMLRRIVMRPHAAMQPHSMVTIRPKYKIRIGDRVEAARKKHNTWPVNNTRLVRAREHESQFVSVKHL